MGRAGRIKGVVDEEDQHGGSAEESEERATGETRGRHGRHGTELRVRRRKIIFGPLKTWKAEWAKDG